jgi:3-hydroxyacyl-CoA dehydrogenase/3a,7a,12a-trihydroxy-5b-cholest-24-enoyl-CoA hydratase
VLTLAINRVKEIEAMKFEDQVVLVTGASRGLGKAFARCMAEAGAVVAVNSTGANEAGPEAVDEISRAGGRAFHVPGRVEEAEALVEATLKQGGRLDAIVHNAGFVRDKSLRKMSLEQWDAVLDVHLRAAFRLSQAAWSSFEEQGGGRLVFLSSSAGLYGNFGQANYAAAKMGMYGLCRTIAIEGKKANIHCNCVAPFGATELNSGGMPDALKAAIKTASAGAFKKVRWERSEGLRLDTSKPLTIDDIAKGWDRIVDFSSSEHPKDMNEALMGLYAGKRASP